MKGLIMDLDTLIDEIVVVEKEMFLAVKTEGECECQADIDSFTFHRKVQFMSWDAPTLRLYRDHIKKSWRQDINLMTIKYARMEEQIPSYSRNPLIHKILNQLIAWQREMKDRYPKIMAKSRPVTEADHPPLGVRSFERYMSSELETYSDDVLSSLYDRLQYCIKNGINMSMLSYEYMVHALGFESLYIAESKIS